MLIVCPSCATSYMLDPATLGPAGRTVRCARCKATWFAGGPHNVTALSSGPKIEFRAEPEVSAFVDGVIAEAEAQESESHPPEPSPGAEAATQAPSPPDEDFSGESPQAGADQPPPAPSQASEPRLPRAEPFAPLPAEESPQPVAPAPEDGPPEPIVDAPPLVPPIEHEEPAEAAPPETEDVESFAARRLRLQSRRKKARRSSRWTAIVLLLFAFNVALIGARNDIVRYLPQTASLFAAIGLPVNLRHLKFEHVRISRENADGTSILVVQGAIVSTADKPVEVPRLRFAARNKAGREIYTWTMKPDRGVLKPGERLDFASRLASPPKDAHDVLVRFFTASDAMAGGK